MRSCPCGGELIPVLVEGRKKSVTITDRFQHDRHLGAMARNQEKTDQVWDTTVISGGFYQFSSLFLNVHLANFFAASCNSQGSHHHETAQSSKHH